MLSEYWMLMGGKLGLDAITIQEIVIGFLTVLGLAGAGFVFKGVWGAIGAIGFGLLAYLFWNQISLY